MEAVVCVLGPEPFCVLPHNTLPIVCQRTDLLQIWYIFFKESIMCIKRRKH